jgi:hypothetical protein
MDTREYFMTSLPVILEYYLAALAERQREQPLHEIVAPSKQAVALVQDDELGMLPSLALQRTELQHGLRNIRSRHKDGGYLLVASGVCGMVGAEEGGQEHSRVGL